MFFANNIIIIAYAKRREPGLFCQTCLSFVFSLHCFCPALFKLIREINDFVRAQAVPSVSFVKVFILHFFFLPHISHFWVSCEHLRQWSGIEYFFLYPLRSLVLWRWCHCAWVIGSCPSLAGELAVYLRKCTWDKRGWQECGRPAEWREGRQLATALSELFYLSSWSPPRYCPSCVKDIPRALFWL